MLFPDAEENVHLEREFVDTPFNTRKATQDELINVLDAVPHPRPHWISWILIHAKYDNSFLITDMIKQKVLAGKSYNRTDHYTYLSDLHMEINTCGSYADTKQEGTFQQVSFAVQEERSIS